MKVGTQITTGRPRNSLADIARSQSDKNDFAVAIRSANLQSMIAAALPEKDRAAFVAEIVTAVKTTPKLQECDPESVLAAGLRGRSQNLRLGFHYYIIPYGKLANYQIGYKGLLNLAIASGFYATIKVNPIYADEDISVDPITGAYTMQQNISLFDDEEGKEPVGYACGFLLNNGFKYSDFMTVNKILKHADKHSQAFSLEKFKKLKNGELSEKEVADLSKGSPWYDINGSGFESMCRKTIILKVLNSGFAPITNAMSEAMAIPDEGIIVDTGSNAATSQQTAQPDPLRNVIDTTATVRDAAPAQKPSQANVEPPKTASKPEAKEMTMNYLCQWIGSI